MSSRRVRSPSPPASPLPEALLPLAEDSGDEQMPAAANEATDTAGSSKGKKKGARTSSEVEDTPAASVESAQKKRKNNQQSSANTGDMTVQHRAASRIQALIRGAKTRVAVRKDVLLKAWTELDWREEQDLLSSHSAYEALKRAVTNRMKHDKEDEGSNDAAAPSSAKKKKGGRKSTANAEEEEIACGLLLRDKDRLTFEFVTAMLEHFRQNKQLPASLVHKIIQRVTPILRAEPNIVEVSCTARLIVVGDLHGQLDDLLAIFKLTGMPSPRNRYLFNGDFVDRGQNSVECIMTLLAFHALYPNDVLLNRGNHEARDLNGRDGFESECNDKYKNDPSIFDAFSAVFSLLPLGHLIDNQVFVIHGGLFPDCPSFKELQELDRFHEVPPSQSTQEYLMWSDPQAKKGRAESPRGAGLLFGPEVTKEFLKKNGWNLIVRSHECMEKGYKYHHNETCITVFSASNYCGTVGNDGALVVFERDSDAANASSSTSTTANQTKKDLLSPATVHPLPITPRSPRLAAAALATPPKESPSSKTSVGQQVKLKRSIVTFYAAKKEKQSVFRAEIHSILESDIISKLLQIISDHRLHLVAYYDKIAQAHSASVRTITRAQWAQGLKSVLGVSIPFLEFQDLLGLPKLGVDGKTKGVVDYMAFLARFRPVNLVVLRAQRRAKEMASQQSQQNWGASFDSMADTQSMDPCASFSDTASFDASAIDADAPQDEPDEIVQSILELLNRNRFELENLFHYLDQDNSQTITKEEFRDGILSLQKHLNATFTKQQIDQLLEYIDEDGDGKIQWKEFMDAFKVRDEVLQSHLSRSQSIKEARRGNSVIKLDPEHHESSKILDVIEEGKEEAHSGSSH